MSTDEVPWLRAYDNERDRDAFLYRVGFQAAEQQHSLLTLIERMSDEAGCIAGRGRSAANDFATFQARVLEGYIKGLHERQESRLVTTALQMCQIHPLSRKTFFFVIPNIPHAWLEAYGLHLDELEQNWLQKTNTHRLLRIAVPELVSEQALLQTADFAGGLATSGVDTYFCPEGIRAEKLLRTHRLLRRQSFWQRLIQSLLR